MKTTTLLSFTLVLATAAASRAAEPTVARPGRLPPPSVRFALALEAQTEWQLDAGHRLFDGTRADTGGGVSLSYDLGRLGEATTAAVALGWNQRVSSSRWGARAPEDGRSAGADTSLALETVSLSGLVRWSLAPWIEPHARVAIDGTRADVTLDLDDGVSLTGRSWSAGASAGFGFRLRTKASRLRTLPGDPALALAAAAEGGFHVGLPLTVDVARVPPADAKVAADQIPTGATHLGTLGRSFPYLRISAALLF